MALENDALNEDTRAESILAKLDAAEAAGEAPETRTEPTEEQVSAPEGEKTGEAETPPAGEETGHSEPEIPAIEPPKFLKAEFRQRWSELPTDWQQYWSSQEEENSRAVSTKLSQAAEATRKAEAAQKAADDRAAQVAQEQQRYVQTLAALTQHVETTDPVIAGYNKLRQEGKLVSLAKENPAQYAELDAAYRTRMDAIQAMNAERQKVQQEWWVNHMQREEKALLEKFPDWSEGQKGKQAIDELKGFAAKTYGFKPEEIQTIADHRYVLMANDAAAYHKLKAEVDAEKAKQAAEAQKAKAAIQAKKVTPQGKTVVPSASADIVGKTASERDKALIKQAKNPKLSTMEKAEILANLS